MKKLSFYLSILTATAAYGEVTKKENIQKLCKSKSSCKDKKNKCKCWCSVQCGPRTKKPTDKPKVINGLCYCAKRDIELKKTCPKLPEKID